VHIRGTDLFIAPTLIWDNPKKAGAGKDTRNCSGFLELERFCDADGARGSLIFGLVETAGG
jgi:hypothetical protein